MPVISSKTKLKKQKIVMEPFEDSVHYQTTIRFRFRGMNIGAFLLKRTPHSPWGLTFGFKSPGIHSFLPNQKFEQVFSDLENGLKDLPKEKITFHLGAYKTDEKRQKHLDKLIEKAPSEELKFLLMGEKARVRQLCRQGLREPKSLYIFVTYHSSSGNQHQDWIDKALKSIDEVWTELSGKSQGFKQKRLSKILRRAWADGLVNWRQILEGKLGLKVRPLSSDELWNYQWQRLNVTSPIKVPQEIVVDHQKVTEVIRSRRHGTTLMLETEPEYNREWVKVAGKYIGVLTFWDKPGGWKNKRSQLHYLWDLVARELVTDTEIITQLVPANQKRVSLLVKQATQQAYNRSKNSEKKSGQDIAASLKAKKGVKATEQLLEGDMPLYVATIILVKRDNLEDLEEACRYIENCFHRPAWVVRERQITWKLWLQSMPIVDENLLTSGFIQRRQMYLNSEAPGFLPIVKTWSKDTEGLELISEDGGTPIFIDLFNTGNDKHRHLFVVGTTRSGKSVLVGGILNQALVRDIPVVAIDYPKPDGSSTYTTYTEFMGKRGAYFDVGKESVNMFDRPDLAKLPEDKQLERFEDYKDFLCSCLMVMVIGESNDVLLNQTVRTILYQSLNAFFNDREILKRYDEAETGGLGSLEWEKMPTLFDFLAYTQKLISENHFDHLQTSEKVIPFNSKSGAILPKALEQIILRLQYWTSSRVGKAISNPSSVPSNAALMVLALRQISENEDAAILSLVAYAAALRRAMSHPLSIFFIDESPILFKFPSVVRLVASIISNGAKSGVRVVLSAQDPNSIANTEAGAQILQNINTRIIGRVQPTAIDSFERILNYDPLLIGRCASFEPKPWGLYTNWLVDDNGTISFCRYYVPKTLLGLVANNTDEQGVREEFLRAYPNKYEAISYFSQALCEGITAQKSLQLIKHKYLPKQLIAA